MNKLEHLLTTGKVYGESGKGRPSDKYLNDITCLHNRDNKTDLIRDSDDGVRWQTIAAHSYQHGP